eukprot:scpid105399/ scgid34057/ 
MVASVLQGRGISPNRHALAVTSYLTGKALAAYNALPSSDLGDFDKVKAAVLGRFQIDGGAYRRRFRQAALKPDETCMELHHRLCYTYGKWLQCTPAKSSDSIKDLLIRLS